jgi:hypothetical protein
MHFDMKSYLKSTRNHTVKHALCFDMTLTHKLLKKLGKVHGRAFDTQKLNFLAFMQRTAEEQILSFLSPNVIIISIEIILFL